MKPPHGLGRLALIGTLAWLALGAACAAPPAPAVVATPTLPPPPTLEAVPTPAPPATLRIWLPAQFDPNASSQAGRLLHARLEEYAARRQDLRLDVRVKALDGPGGLLDALISASSAAPLALPDLIALPRSALETAALKGLLHPYDGLVTPLDDPGWYEYARQMARLQGSTFGLPFAGDALVLVYRAQDAAAPPDTLASLLELPGPFAFPAADPAALFTLALYQAAGGAIVDDQGRPMLEDARLASILEVYQQGAQKELFPLWLTQFESEEQAWQAFSEGQAQMAAAWASSYLRSLPSVSLAAPLPTPGGEDYTLADGWVWAIASSNAERQEAAAQLAVFLTESRFLAQWDAAAGYLPPSSGALEAWQPAALRPWVDTVSRSAHVAPSPDVLPGLAAPLSQAVVDVLKLQAEPGAAAEQAAASLQAP
ncbi:MAG: extracellular solute-binding protein [Chloroflexi bacterium]|nr:extracellular solute-binding protein [Chloroflexota bacterium]